MGTENNLWKIELDPIIFMNSTGIGNLKSNEVRGSGANLFEEYNSFCNREKGRDLTQSYDISPYTHRKIQKAASQH